MYFPQMVANYLRKKRVRNVTSRQRYQKNIARVISTAFLECSPHVMWRTSNETDFLQPTGLHLQYNICKKLLMNHNAALKFMLLVSLHVEGVVCYFIFICTKVLSLQFQKRLTWGDNSKRWCLYMKYLLSEDELCKRIFPVYLYLVSVKTIKVQKEHRTVSELCI